MERDFMGLGSRDSDTPVKEETVENCKESEFVAFSKGSAVQWPSSNKISVPPHFMAFNPTAEENISKAVPSAELQKVQNGPRGSPFPLPNYRDTKIFSIPNKAISASTNQQLGSPVLRPHPIHPSLGSVVRTRFNLKPLTSPQLTIFYGGTVNVFDNISPEKVQAILFLAGNVSAKVAQPRLQTHLSSQPNLGLSSPLSVSSHPIVQSEKEYSRSKDEVMPIKPVVVLGNPVTRVDPPKMPASTTVINSAVPQARKASLARFLEKRKERVVTSAPYNISK